MFTQIIFLIPGLFQLVYSSQNVECNVTVESMLSQERIVCSKAFNFPTLDEIKIQLNIKDHSGGKTTRIHKTTPDRLRPYLEVKFKDFEKDQDVQGSTPTEDSELIKHLLTTEKIIIIPFKFQALSHYQDKKLLLYFLPKIDKKGKTTTNGTNTNFPFQTAAQIYLQKEANKWKINAQTPYDQPFGTDPTTEITATYDLGDSKAFSYTTTGIPITTYLTKKNATTYNSTFSPFYFYFETNDFLLTQTPLTAGLSLNYSSIKYQPVQHSLEEIPTLDSHTANNYLQANLGDYKIDLFLANFKNNELEIIVTTRGIFDNKNFIPRTRKDTPKATFKLIDNFPLNLTHLTEEGIAFLTEHKIITGNAPNITLNNNNIKLFLQNFSVKTFFEEIFQNKIFIKFDKDKPAKISHISNNLYYYKYSVSDITSEEDLDVLIDLNFLHIGDVVGITTNLNQNAEQYGIIDAQTEKDLPFLNGKELNLKLQTKKADPAPDAEEPPRRERIIFNFEKEVLKVKLGQHFPDFKKPTLIVIIKGKKITIPLYDHKGDNTVKIITNVQGNFAEEDKTDDFVKCAEFSVSINPFELLHYVNDLTGALDANSQVNPITTEYQLVGLTFETNTTSIPGTEQIYSFSKTNQFSTQSKSPKPTYHLKKAEGNKITFDLNFRLLNFEAVKMPLITLYSLSDDKKSSLLYIPSFSNTASWKLLFTYYYSFTVKYDIQSSFDIVIRTTVETTPQQTIETTFKATHKEKSQQGPTPSSLIRSFTRNFEVVNLEEAKNKYVKFQQAGSSSSNSGVLKEIKWFKYKGEFEAPISSTEIDSSLTGELDTAIYLDLEKSLTKKNYIKSFELIEPVLKLAEKTVDLTAENLATLRKLVQDFNVNTNGGFNLKGNDKGLKLSYDSLNNANDQSDKILSELDKPVKEATISLDLRDEGLSNNIFKVTFNTLCVFTSANPGPVEPTQSFFGQTFNFDKDAIPAFCYKLDKPVLHNFSPSSANTNKDVLFSKLPRLVYLTKPDGNHGTLNFKGLPLLANLETFKTYKDSKEETEKLLSLSVKEFTLKGLNYTLKQPDDESKSNTISLKYLPFILSSSLLPDKEKYELADNFKTLNFEQRINLLDGSLSLGLLSVLPNDKILKIKLFNEKEFEFKNGTEFFEFNNYLLKKAANAAIDDNKLTIGFSLGYQTYNTQFNLVFGIFVEIEAGEAYIDYQGKLNITAKIKLEFKDTQTDESKKEIIQNLRKILAKKNLVVKLASSRKAGKATSAELKLEEESDEREENLKEIDLRFVQTSLTVEILNLGAGKKKTLFFDDKLFYKFGTKSIEVEGSYWIFEQETVEVPFNTSKVFVILLLVLEILGTLGLLGLTGYLGYTKYKKYEIRRKKRKELEESDYFY